MRIVNTKEKFWEDLHKAQLRRKIRFMLRTVLPVKLQPNILVALATRKIEMRNTLRWRHSMAMASCQYVFGGKYDLIQLHRQIIHQMFFHHKNTITTSNFYSNLKKTMKMTWHFVISAVWVGSVFGPCLWQLSACRRLLAGRGRWNFDMFLYEGEVTKEFHLMDNPIVFYSP